MVVECPDEICYFENQFLNYCLVFLPNSNPNCSIPCQKEFCDHEIMSDIMCPYWSCTPKSTTTPTTSEMPSTETPPTEGPPTNLMVSYSFNGFFASILFLLFSYFIYKKIYRRILLNRLERQSRAQRTPSVRFTITESPSSSSSDTYSVTKTYFTSKNSPENIQLMKKKRNRRHSRAQIDFQNQMDSFMNENFNDSGDPITVRGAEFLNSSSDSATLPAILPVTIVPQRNSESKAKSAITRDFYKNC